MNKKFICPICGYVHEGAPAPERCPQCKQVVTWKEVDESAGIAFACEHIIGVAKDTDEERHFRFQKQPYLSPSV